MDVLLELEQFIPFLILSDLKNINKEGNKALQTLSICLMLSVICKKDLKIKSLKMNINLYFST